MSEDSIPEGYTLDEPTPAPQDSSDIPEGYTLDPAEDQIPEGYQLDEKKYTTPGQKVLTAIEGLGRGATAGLSDALAGGMRKVGSELGVAPENLHYIAPNPVDIAGRQEQNPIESTASEIIGNVGLLKNLPQIGSKAIDGMIKMGVIGAGDELSKAMLGQGDPLTAVASHIAENGAFGLVGGSLFGKAEQLGAKGLKYIENTKVGTAVNSFLSGMGHAATFPSEEILPLEKSSFTNDEIKKLNNKAFQWGQKFYKNMGATAASTIGYHLAGPTGGVLAPTIEKYLEKIIGPTISNISQKYMAPTILKAAASGSVENLSQVLDHASVCSKGFQKISNGVENLFDSTTNKGIEYIQSENKKNKLRDFIENGGTDQQVRDAANKQGIPAQEYADGGEVTVEEPNEISKLYPEQNTLLSAAKGRVSNYLNSVRPIKNNNKLPFDVVHEDPSKEKQYNKTLDLALSPLSILNHVKEGTLVPKQVSDFKSMYPELHEHLSKKITERLAKMNMDDEKKPPYKTRQAMSLFMGANLDSTLTPQSMMASQNVFAQQNAQRQQMKNTKSSLTNLGKSSMTPDQGRESRLNKI